MQLRTLLGKQKTELYTNKPDCEWIEKGDLKQKFDYLVEKLDLNPVENDGLIKASDNTGSIQFKQINGFEWYLYEPKKEITIEETARIIFEEYKRIIPECCFTCSQFDLDNVKCKYKLILPIKKQTCTKWSL